MSKGGYIYALVIPVDCRIFYIGSTIQPLSERLARHISDVKTNPYCNENLKLEIDKLRVQGLLPLIIELEQFVFGKYDCYDLNDRESDFIKLFANQGYKLANKNSKKKTVNKGFTGKMAKSYLTKAPNASKLDIRKYI